MDKEKIFDELVARKISFSEAENESKQCKSLSAVKDAEVQLKSWDEVEDVIKNIGGKERLASFNVRTLR